MSCLYNVHRKVRTRTRASTGATHVRVCTIVSVVGPLQAWSHHGHERAGGQHGCRRGQCPCSRALFPVMSSQISHLTSLFVFLFLLLKLFVHRHQKGCRGPPNLPVVISHPPSCVYTYRLTPYSGPYDLGEFLYTYEVLYGGLILGIILFSIWFLLL